MRKKIMIATVAFMAITAPASANALTWRTIDSDADYGSGFSIVHAEGRTGTNHFTWTGHARPMRVWVKGKPGTRVTASATLKCWDYDPEWKYDLLYETDTLRWNWSFRATNYPSIRRLSVYDTSPPYLTWWDACEATVNAYTRDSGPLVAKVQKGMPY